MKKQYHNTCKYDIFILRLQCDSVRNSTHKDRINDKAMKPTTIPEPRAKSSTVLTALKRVIDVDSETRLLIREQTGMSYDGIYAALNFIRNGEDSKAVRDLAIRLGGIYCYRKLPVMDSLYDDNHDLRQYFIGGEMIVWEKSTSNIYLYDADGSLWATADGVTSGTLLEYQGMVYERYKEQGLYQR